jgi:hypothetical protein
MATLSAQAKYRIAACSIAGTIIGVVGFTFVAFYTGAWQWLAGTALSLLVVRRVLR